MKRMSQTAVFIGGPADGQGMRVPELAPFTLLVPVNNEPVYATFDLAAPLATPRWRAARYDRQRIAGLPESSLEFYTFGGYDE